MRQRVALQFSFQNLHLLLITQSAVDRRQVGSNVVRSEHR